MTLQRTGVRLVIDNLRGFLSGMSQYNAAVGRADKSTRQFAETAGRAGRAFALLGAPIVGFAAVSVKAAVEFDTALVGVAKTTGATAAEVELLGKQFRSLALEIPVSARELAGIGEIAGRLGVRVGDIRAFTETVAALGVATDLSSESSAEFLARIQAITGLPANQIENFGSALVALGNNLATSESEIAAFTIRMAGAANVAGLAQSDILAIAGSFSELGVRADRGGTAVQKVLFTMIEAITTAGPELQTFAKTAGVTAEEFATLFEEDAAEAFTQFVEGLGRSGDQAFAVLQELGLQDQRLAAAFITVAAAGSNLRENIDLSTVAFAANTALVTEAEARYASAASQFKIFLNQVTELAIVVGDILLPPLLALAQVLRPIVQLVADFAEANPILVGAVVAVGLALVALGGILIVISLVMPGLIILFPALAGGLTLSAIAAGALSIALGPITLIVIGIAVAIAAGIIIWKNWGAIMDFVSEKVSNFVDLLEKAIRLAANLNPIIAGLNLLEVLTPIDIPLLAHGGDITRGGLAVVGERGPEVVSLPAGASVTPNVSHTTTFHVNANYPNRQDPATITQDLQTMRMMAGR